MCVYIRTDDNWQEHSKSTSLRYIQPRKSTFRDSNTEFSPRQPFVLLTMMNKNSYQNKLKVKLSEKDPIQTIPRPVRMSQKNQIFLVISFVF